VGEVLIVLETASADGVTLAELTSSRLAGQGATGKFPVPGSRPQDHREGEGSRLTGRDRSRCGVAEPYSQVGETMVPAGCWPELFWSP